MNNADNSLSKALLWNKVLWDLIEFLAEALSQSVYAGIDVVSHDRHVDAGSSEMHCSCGIKKDASLFHFCPSAG